MNPLGLPAILTGFVLIQVVHGALVALARWQGRERPPVTGKLLRPPGENLRVRLTVLEDRARWMLIATTTIPVVVLLAGALAFTGRTTEEHGLTIPILTAVGFVLTAGAGGYFLYRTFTERRKNTRALQGHRIVNDSLAALVPSGFKIFHDVPTDASNTSGNLHHVVIGNSGIFAIESSTPASRPATPGRKPQEIIFDGDQLIYPWGQDTLALVPARRKAEWLAEWIYQLVGERVPVNAVLTFPGWWITCTANRDLRVCNPDQLAALMLQAGSAGLTEHTRNLVIRSLEVRCRDVEF
jgi:Nuclease-related domain